MSRRMLRCIDDIIRNGTLTGIAPARGVGDVFIQVGDLSRIHEELSPFSASNAREVDEWGLATMSAEQRRKAQKKVLEYISCCRIIAATLAKCVGWALGKRVRVCSCVRVRALFD